MNITSWDAVPEDLKVDHLILLVGGNPLPNALAARILAKPAATIHLLYSSPEGVPVAKALETWLTAHVPGHTLNRLSNVDEASPTSIRTSTRTALDGCAGAQVGLHYTGGTKAMAVHAYREVERWWNEKAVKKAGTPRPQCTYLDARGLKLVIDPATADKAGQEIAEPIGHLEVTFDDLLSLHRLQRRSAPPDKGRVQPILKETAKALASGWAMSKPDGRPDWQVVNAWGDWKKVLRVQLRKDNQELKRVNLSLPTASELDTITATLRRELGLVPDVTTVNLGEAAQAASRSTGASVTPRELCEWLDAKWLESATLAALLDVHATRGDLHDLMMGVKFDSVDRTSTARDFELDAVAMRGYQLFAISCGVISDGSGAADGDRAKLKLKLFEVIARARQLGGDEARAALVCGAKNPKSIEDEVGRDLDLAKGRIRVFGKFDLPHLAPRLREWIASQSP